MQAWIELSTLEGPDYFGEAAVLTRGLRHASAIAHSNVELLVLSKVDFDLKIDSKARELVGVLVSKYPKDHQLLRCAPKPRCATRCCGVHLSHVVAHLSHVVAPKPQCRPCCGGRRVCRTAWNARLPVRGRVALEGACRCLLQNGWRSSMQHSGGAHDLIMHGLVACKT